MKTKMVTVEIEEELISELRKQHRLYLNDGFDQVCDYPFLKNNVLIKASIEQVIFYLKEQIKKKYEELENPSF